jgi:hypothetical protein
MTKRPETSLSGPTADPAHDPRAAAYAREIQNRRLPKYTAPVGGMPLPHIPHLDGGHQEGRTMTEQARPPAAPAAPGTPGIFGAPPVSAASFGILPADALPEEARQDPSFREGPGALLAAAQPSLAMKYGVIRNGQRLMPQQLRPGPRRSIEDTRADLRKVEELSQARRETETGQSAAERQSEAGLGGAAARIADGPAFVNEEKEKFERTKAAIEKMDDFDFDTFRRAMMKDLLNNDEQKQIIEARLEPMLIDDLIIQGYVTQRVPIIPGKFEPTFRSMTGEEDLALKRLIMLDSEGQASNQYLLDKFSLMSVACGLHAINTRPFPSHTDNQGGFDDKAFWEKFTRVFKLPMHMLASLGVNYFWFDVRVRKLFVAENLKNG